jgi:hypothetical protein
LIGPDIVRYPLGYDFRLLVKITHRRHISGIHEAFPTFRRNNP